MSLFVQDPESDYIMLNRPPAEHFAVQQEHLLRQHAARRTTRARGRSGRDGEGAGPREPTGAPRARGPRPPRLAGREQTRRPERDVRPEDTRASLLAVIGADRPDGVPGLLEDRSEMR